MSGGEVIGLISGILGILDAILNVWGATSDASGLPETFRDVAERLPLVGETIQTARETLKSSTPDEAFCVAMKPVLDRCKDRATRLEVIFQKVIPRADTSRMERYLLATRTLGKGNRVESLMKGILEDVQLMAGNRTMKLAADSQLLKLAEATREVSAIPPSLLDESPTAGIFNSGSWTQHNNNNSSGKQFIGVTFSGHVNIL